MIDFKYEGDFEIREIEENRDSRQLIEPVISAYNADAFRMPRLYRAWGRAEATVRLLSTRYRNSWSGAIVSLHDEKGTLEVLWRDKLSRIMFEGVIVGAWRDEGECCHAHAVTTD